MTNEPDLTNPDEVSQALDVEEQPDGSAIVHMDKYKGPSEDEEFYSNLAETVDLWQLQKIGMKYLDLIEKDKQAREKRDKQYEEGIRRTGLGDDAPVFFSLRISSNTLAISTKSFVRI